METILPQGEAVRKSIRWISEQLKEDKNQSIKKLVQEAIFRFNLSPKDAEFLMQFYKNHS
jgi:hypothetical protein